MLGPDSAGARERLRQALYERSYKRLKKRGVDEEECVRIAGEVARQATERTQTPDFASREELAVTVRSVCEALSEGKSYYDLMCERPYLATGRIDRLVAAAGTVRPQVSAELAVAAKKATGLERLSGGLAVVFTAIALVALGVWWALGVGILVAVAGELYVQTGMPPWVRRTAARYRLAQWLGLVAVATLVYFGYAWSADRAYSGLVLGGLIAFAFFVAFIVPGLTLAVMVGRRERKWRDALEDELVEKTPGGPAA